MRRTLAALALLLLAAMPAKASPIGTQVSGTLVNQFGDDLFAAAGIPQPATIADAGIEFSNGSAFLSRIEVDFGANSLTLRLVKLPESFVYCPYTATFTFLTPGLVTGVGVQGGGTVPLASGPTLTGDVLTFGTEPVLALQGGYPEPHPGLPARRRHAGARPRRAGAPRRGAARPRPRAGMPGRLSGSREGMPQPCRKGRA